MTSRLSFSVLLLPLLSGCGPSATEDANSPGSGGHTNTEHPNGSGGDTQTGGAPSTGGSGEAQTGGATGSGGTDGTGGAETDSGGSPSSGGGAADGGASATGGASSLGEIVLEATFDARSAGPYTEALVEEDFGVSPSWNDGLDEGRAAIVMDDGNPFLRVTYPADQYGPSAGGVQFILPLGDSYEELYLTYRVRFGGDFEFVKGGKLPGLVGGSHPTGCVQDDTGFSARMMWRAGGHAVQYLYFAEKVNDCGDDYDYRIGNTDALFSPNVWHTVEHRIRMNTPGATDGIMQAWFDGQLALDEQSFVWRAAGQTWSIDALYFSTFFGGSDNTWAPSADQTIDYDSFVISAASVLR